MPLDPPDPRTVLRKPLKVGMAVCIKVGFYRGRRGVVEELLTPPADPAFITGMMRYGIRCAWDNQLRDYCAYEVKRGT